MVDDRREACGGVLWRDSVVLGGTALYAARRLTGSAGTNCMNAARSRRTVAVGLVAALLLSVGAWVAGAQIRSPAQVAAETAAPDPSAITVPVEDRVLSSEVIVRGTVRYGSPQPVVLATSEIKQGGRRERRHRHDAATPGRAGRRGHGGDVGLRPAGVRPARRAGLSPGHAARQQRPGRAPARAGAAPPGLLPGTDRRSLRRRDRRRGGQLVRERGLGAVRLHRRPARRAPHGAGERRRRPATHICRACVTIKTTRDGVPRGDIAQARIDLETARDSVDTAQHTLATQGRGVSLALANERRDNAVAAADIATKRAAVNKTRDAQLDAQRTLAEAPPGTSPSELAALQAAVRQASDDVAVAQEDLNASIASADATREAGQSAVAAREGRPRPGAERAAHAHAVRWCSPSGACGC